MKKCSKQFLPATKKLCIPMKTLVLILLTISCFSCSSSDDGNSCVESDFSGFMNLESSLDAATELYFEDITNNANCVALKDKGMEFRELATRLLACDNLTETDRADVNRSVGLLDASLALLPCN